MSDMSPTTTTEWHYADLKQGYKDGLAGGMVRSCRSEGYEQGLRAGRQDRAALTEAIRVADSQIEP